MGYLTIKVCMKMRPWMGVPLRVCLTVNVPPMMQSWDRGVLGGGLDY
jgi:hypothetical protein